MNSFQIRYYLKRMNYNIHTGAYAIDQIKHIKAKTFAIVVNNMPSSSGGIHWFALFKPSETSRIELFDSLALPVETYYPELKDFFEANGKRFVRCIRRVQSLRSNKCGFHSCYFLKNRLNGKSYKDVLKSYSKSYNYNDKLVSKRINVKFLKFSRCTKMCLKDPFVNVCFQRSKACYHFEQ